MRNLLFILISLALAGDILANELTSGREIISKEPGRFYIVKVNRVEKLWMVPPDRRGFIGSRGVGKFDYARSIPGHQQGEHYVVTWRYRGEKLTEPLTMKFEYRVALDPEQKYLEEQTYPDLKSGNYEWVFENVGADFTQKGKVTRWKVSLVYQDRPVIVKRSATWRAMEGD